MPSERNRRLLETLESSLEGVDTFLLVDYQGLDAKAEGTLRRLLKERGARFVVAKNTLIERALQDLNIPQPELKGPSALVFGADPSVTAKALKEFARGNEKGIPRLKGGVLSRKLLSLREAETLAELPSRDELRAELVSVLEAPLSQLLQVLSGVSQELVGILDAYVGQQSTN